MNKIIFAIFLVGFVEKCFSRRDDYHYNAVKIGGLFDSTKEAETVFKYAVMNTQRDTNAQTIKGTSMEIFYGNEFIAAQSVCKMIENGNVGIIGPTAPESAIHVRSICDAKEIPLIETSIDGSSKHVINLHPTPEELGKVYLDMILVSNWQGFTIIYQDAPWLPLVEYVLKNYNKGYTVTVRELDITGNNNYRPQLRRVKQSDDRNVLLCCSINALPEILKQSQQVGLLTDEHKFIITTLDMHTIDLEPFQHSGTNITGFRLVSPNDEYVKQVTENFENFFFKSNNFGETQDENEQNRDEQFPYMKREELPEGLTAEKLQLNTALTYDAVTLFSLVMAQHRGIHSESVICDDRTSTFVNGTSIFNSMKTIAPFKGLSGEIQFDQQGNREHFNLEILELASEGLKVVGTWNSTNGMKSLRGKPFDTSQTDPDNLRNKTLIILTVINPPYGMLKETMVPLKGNDRFEGFGIELIEKLANRLGFNYTFQLQEDGRYGSPDKTTGEWDGMVRELMDDRADLAITDLTITAERESAVDFTMPFMTLGISILFEKPKKEDPELFSFMQPFSSGVWGCLFGCFFLVTISLFVMGRLSPAEWDNPYPCIEEPEVLINQFSFKNSMWFSIGALLQQGSEIAPKAPSTRVVASLWWFFTLIMVSSYTANLAAFLTIENPSPLIEGVDDLVAGKVPYGAKKGGSTVSFFRDSANPNFIKMSWFMSNNTELMTDTNDEGVERAIKGKYAFLMESSTIEYQTERKCSIVQVGSQIDEKGYGIAMKKNSPFRGALSEAVLQMQESGEISRMKTKWWKEKRGGGACGGPDGDANVAKLNMKNVGGVFAVLAGGCVVALIQGIFKWIYNIRNMSKSLDIPFGEVFSNEFRFFRKFGENVKTVQTRKSSSQLEYVNDSTGTRSRSSGVNNMNESIGFRMSLKNINKVAREEEYEKI